MLTDLHTAIVARLTTDMPTLQTCAAYPDLQRRVVLPAVLVDIPELYPSVDAGTEQLGLTASCRALCIYDPKQANADLEVRNLAAMVAYNIYKASRFGQPVSPAKIRRIGEDAFEPELDGYLVWVVEWIHDIQIGNSIWDGAGVTPSEINVSSLGAAHEPLE